MNLFTLKMVQLSMVEGINYLRKNIFFIALFLSNMVIVDGIFGDKVLFFEIGVIFLGISILFLLKKEAYLKYCELTNNIFKKVTNSRQSIIREKNRYIEMLCFSIGAIAMFISSKITSSTNIFIDKSVQFFLFMVALSIITTLFYNLIFVKSKNSKNCMTLFLIVGVISIMLFIFIINYVMNLSFIDYKNFINSGVSSLF